MTKDGGNEEEGVWRRRRDIPCLAERTTDLSAFVPMWPYWKSPRGH